jgi:hypothetical protein
MAVIMISDVPGGTPELIEQMRQAGVLDQLRKAPGFRGHWSGPTGSAYRVIEVWESPDDWRAWYGETIAPKLPPGMAADEPTFLELTMTVEAAPPMIPEPSRAAHAESTPPVTT